MKKKIRFMGIAAIVAITVFLVSCGDPSPCNVKHSTPLVACTGNVTGCGVYNYGGTGKVNNIPVYRTVGVDHEEAEDAFTALETAFARDFSGKANYTAAKVSAFHIDTANGISSAPAPFIIRLNYANNADVMEMRLEMHGTEQLDFAMLMQQNGVRLADNNGHARVPGTAFL